MSVIDASASKRGICYTHSWSTTEMFLYLYEFRR